MPENTTAASVRADLRELAEPLKQQLRTIEARQRELSLEAEDLRAAHAQLVQVLRRIDPDTKPSKPGSKAGRVTAERMRQRKREAIEQLVQEGSEDGFTASDLERTHKQNSNEPPISTTTFVQTLKELQNEGIIRLDRMTKGGGRLYKRIG